MIPQSGLQAFQTLNESWMTARAVFLDRDGIVKNALADYAQASVDVPDDLAGGEQITVGAKTYNFVLASPGTDEILIDGASTFENFAAKVNADIARTGCTANGTANPVVLTAVKPGVVGNAILLSAGDVAFTIEQFSGGDDAPIPCRVSDRMPGRGGESEQGAQLTTETEKEIAVPLGTTVKTSWRVRVTFPDNTVAEYDLVENQGVVSDATQITLRAVKGN
jgi:hypothetical protein